MTWWLSCGFSFCSSFSIAYLSHQCTLKHPSSFLFDLFLIDEEITVVMLQKIEELHDSLNDEELSIDLSSVDEELHGIEAPQFIDAR